MKLLLIEDDELKRRQITEWLSETRPDVNVEMARSYNSAIRAATDEAYDIVLLDMAMTTFDVSQTEPTGGRPQPFAGRDIIRQFARRDIKLPVVVVTQFDYFGDGPDRRSLEQLDHELAEDYPGQYLGAVFFSQSSDDWKDQLRTLIEAAIDADDSAS